MTKPEYLEWLRTRGEVGTWNLAKCHAADALVKREALKGCAKYVARANPTVRDYVLLMASATFGSVETDQFLTKIGAYPAWLNGEPANA